MMFVLGLYCGVSYAVGYNVFGQRINLASALSPVTVPCFVGLLLLTMRRGG